MLPYDCIVLFCDEIENRLYGSGNLAASKAAGANVNVLNGTVEISLYSSDVGLPTSVSFSVRVGNVTTERYALSAY